MDRPSEVDGFLLTIDCDGMIVEANERWVHFCSTYGVKESLWKTGTSYFAQLAEQGRTADLLAIQKAIASGKAEIKQLHSYLLKNGLREFFDVTISAKIFPASQTRGAILSLKPFSLAPKTISTETILKSMNDGFALVDENLKISYLNEIGAQLMDFTWQEVIGKSLLELFPEVDGSSFQKEYRRALEKQKTIELIDYFAPLDTWFQLKLCPLETGGLALYFQDISEYKKTEKRLLESANYDYLTDLANRRLLNQCIHGLVEDKKKFTIFHVNIDNLKSINEKHGYETGDLLLQKVADDFKQLQSEKCAIGRLDGDDFIFIVQPEIKQNLEIFAERIRLLFKQPVPISPSISISVSVSIGIACFPYDASTPDEVLSNAETAMHYAKDTRGSSFQFFRSQMKQSRDRQSEIEKGLFGDFSENGFFYVLQPQIDGPSGNIAGAEVLMRWNHPKFGMVSPVEFIKTAEETGSIIPLTTHLLKRLFTQIKKWEACYGWNLRIAINVTPSLLANPHFFSDFFELIHEYEINPNTLEIEITEQAELTYTEEIMQNLLLCQSKGITIAIDDFGTGFSMISYLTHFPIDKIKIDKFFIQKIGQDFKSEAVLKSLIHLAKSIECDLLAEGVERLEEVEFLEANGCRVFQGYWFDRPLSIHDFEEKYLKSQIPL